MMKFKILLSTFILLTSQAFGGNSHRDKVVNLGTYITKVPAEMTMEEFQEISSDISAIVLNPTLFSTATCSLNYNRFKTIEEESVVSVSLEIQCIVRCKKSFDLTKSQRHLLNKLNEELDLDFMLLIIPGHQPFVVGTNGAGAVSSVK